MIDKHIISTDATLIEALRQLNELSGGVMTLFAVDPHTKAIEGTITDGDIRRALIAGATTESMVAQAMHRSFKYLDADNIDVEHIREYRASGINLVPVIDKDRHITDIIDLRKTHSKLPMSAILMAGGKGERLRPLTIDTPKPLLEIYGKAIIDYNIEALAAVGITDITVTTRYLADKIYSHFSDPVAGVKVKCVREDAPLGTIGAASLVDIPAEGNTLVMNSDLLTTISFEDMYLRHITEKADITIAAIPYSLSVPYAILTTASDDTNRVIGIEEKPSYSYYANAGIYIISNSLLRALPRDTRTDATDLIELAIADGRRVVYYPINGTWIDVGSPTDFKQATELMRHHRNLLDKF